MSLLMTVPATSAFLSRRGEGGLHPGSPSQMTMQAGNGQSAIAGTSVAVAPSVLLRDQLGQPVAGYPLQFVPVGGSTASELVNDTFTRTNENPLTGNWTRAPSFTSLQLINNTVQGVIAAGEGIAYYNGLSWPADQYAECQVVALGASGARGGGPAVRISTAVQSAYLVQVQLTGTGVALCKYDAGTFAVLQNITTAVGSTDTIRLEARGTTLRVYKNGAQIGTDTQDGALAAGQAGLDIYSNTTFAVDNWAAGVPPTTSGTVSPDAAIFTTAAGIAAPDFWTLGTVAGINTLSVSLPGVVGSPVLFTATGTSGSGQATQIAINGGTGQSATVGTAVSVAPSVIVKDSGGAPVAGVVVTFAVVAGGGAITGASQTTNASGIATVGSWTLGSTAGANSLTATSPGLTGSPLTFTATGTSSVTFDFYVSTTGGTGAGTIGDPWSLSYAFSGAGGALTAGKTVAIRGGTYGSGGPGFAFTVNVSGAQGVPIIFRNYPDERVIIDGSLLTNSGVADVWFQGTKRHFIVRNSDHHTVGSNNEGIFRIATRGKLINLIVHDARRTGILNGDTLGTEINGCIVYNNGSTSNQDHGFYMSNTAGTKLIKHNVVFTNWQYNFHFFNATAGTLVGLLVHSNVLWGASEINAAAGNSAANILLAGSASVDCQIHDNYVWSSAAEDGNNQAAQIGDASAGQTISILRNRFLGRRLQIGTFASSTFNDNVLYSPSELVRTVPDTWTWSNNTHYRLSSALAWVHNGTAQNYANWKVASGRGATDTNPGTVPTTNEIFVLVNAYEPKRAIVVIYNWQALSTVAVDLSTVLANGDLYEIHNVQALSMPNGYSDPNKVTGTYTGVAVSVPMAGIAIPAPLDRTYTTPPVTGPAFNVFLVHAG